MRRGTRKVGFGEERARKKELLCSFENGEDVEDALWMHTARRDRRRCMRTMGNRNGNGEEGWEARSSWDDCEARMLAFTDAGVDAGSDLVRFSCSKDPSALFTLHSPFVRRFGGANFAIVEGRPASSSYAPSSSLSCPAPPSAIYATSPADPTRTANSTPRHAHVLSKPTASATLSSQTAAFKFDRDSASIKSGYRIINSLTMMLSPWPFLRSSTKMG